MSSILQSKVKYDNSESHGRHILNESFTKMHIKHANSLKEEKNNTLDNRTIHTVPRANSKQVTHGHITNNTHNNK